MSVYLANVADPNLRVFMDQSSGNATGIINTNSPLKNAKPTGD